MKSLILKYLLNAFYVLLFLAFIYIIGFLIGFTQFSLLKEKQYVAFGLITLFEIALLIRLIYYLTCKWKTKNELTYQKKKEA